MCNLVDNTDEHRFEMVQSGQKTFVGYICKDGILVLFHTEVPASLRGKGAGSKLARAVLDAVKSRKMKVRITCDFLLHFISKNPEYQVLVSP